MALPFGFTNVAAAYQEVLRGKFADQDAGIHPLTDQIVNQVSSTVNMLHVGRRPEASL